MERNDDSAELMREMNALREEHGRKLNCVWEKKNQVKYMLQVERGFTSAI